MAIGERLWGQYHPANREHVDKRLQELKQQKKQLETRLKELERLNISQDEIEALVTEAMTFISGLEFILMQGLPQEKLATLRQCVEKIHINKPINEIILQVREVPTGNLKDAQELVVLI